jgi:hypothetical protein
MDLKWFHLVFITTAIVMSAAVAAWALGADRMGLAGTAAVAGVVLILYEGFFLNKTRKIDSR